MVGRAAAAIAVGAALTVAACSSSTAAKDVSITACTASPSGSHPVADGRIQNHSSKASTYAISVTFKDQSGNRVSEGATGVAKVDSGGVATWHATGVASAKGPVTCSIDKVTRTIAP